MRSDSSEKVDELSNTLGISRGVARELLVLSGGDVELAVKCSVKSRGLDQCKAAIIDERFKNIEEVL